MEHSKIIGSKEGYGSSVSGWTMYIGSPVHNNDNYDDDDHSTDEQANKCNKYYNGYNDDDDDDASGKSDDSMASDASSGPSHRGLPWESRHGASKYSSKEKLHEQKMKRNERRSKVESDKPVPKPKGAANQAQTGGKVRKTIYTGKEK